MPELYADEKTKPVGEAKEVALWQERIQLAKKELEQWSDESGANRFIKEYSGNYDIVFHTRSRKIKIPPINDVFSYVQSDIATTYNRDPYIAVNAKAGTTKGAALWETILNYYWRELKTKDELEYEIVDKDLVGYGWHKVGHAVNSVGKNEKLKIVDEKLYSAFLSWRDVVWNIGSKRPPIDCRWMAQRIVRPLKEIKKKYPNAKGLAGSPDPTMDKDSYKKLSYKDDIEVGVMWEIWDAEEQKIRLIAENLKDRYLDDPKPWPEYQDEFPFLMYWDFIVPDKSRPLSAIAPWEPQILEEMVLMGSAINHSKRWNRQAFANNQSFSPQILDAFERGDDGAIHQVAGKVGAEDLRFVDFGALPTDFYLLMDRLQAIKRTTNGQPEFTQGGVTKTNTRTIGELQLMQQGARGRQDRKVDRLETHCENIARHMLMHLKANFDFEETVKITGEIPEEIIQALGNSFDPVTKSVKFSPQDIEGEYDVEIKSGSTLPMDKANRIRIEETILQSLASVANQPLSRFMVALIKGLLRDYDVKELEEAYQADLEEAEQQKQQAAGQEGIQTQKVLAEAAKREAQAGQIHAETAVAEQEATIGPLGRAQLERLKKEPLVPRTNGTSR